MDAMATVTPEMKQCYTVNPKNDTEDGFLRLRNSSRCRNAIAKAAASRG